MAQVVNGVKDRSQRSAMRETLRKILGNMKCGKEDRECVLKLADDDSDSPHARTSNTSSLEQLRRVVNDLGTKHRDSIYLLRMESVGLEPGFPEFVQRVDLVNKIATKLLRSDQLRQRV